MRDNLVHELRGDCAIRDAMVETQREIENTARLHFAVDNTRKFPDTPYAEDSDFGIINDGGEDRTANTADVRYCE